MIQTKLILKYIKEVYSFQPNQLFLVGIRGYIPTADGIKRVIEKIDNFDDSLLVFVPNGKSWDVKVFPCTLDPGLAWILKPMKGLIGTGRQEEGWTKYRHGLHKGKRALVQAAKVRTRRDTNRDGVWQESEPVEEGWFAINIHYRFTRERKVGINSASCTVIDSLIEEKIYQEFLKLVEKTPVIDRFLLNQSTADALFIT